MVKASDGERSTGGSDLTWKRVYDAALRLFADRGFEATGIREIARDAGVNSASLYHYMSSKDDLLIEIMRSGFHTLTAGAVDALSEVDSPAEELAALVRWHVTYHGRQRLVSLVSDNELRALDDVQRKSMIKLRDRYEALWTEVITGGMADGSFRVKDERMVRLAILPMCSGVVYWFSPSGGKSLPEIADEFVEFALLVVGYTAGPPDHVLVEGEADGEDQ